MKAIFDTKIDNLKLLHQGKVRDIYHVDDEHMLIVATDRLSAFDVVLPTPIPGKGAVLASVSNFWFNRTKGIVKNHCSTVNLQEVITNKEQYELYKSHAVVVKKMKALPIEAIVRGYIIGSGWKDYQKTGNICGIPLPARLKLAQKLPQTLYTPSSKAAVGSHDENIDFEKTVELVGREMAEQLKKVSIEIYTQAADYAKSRGIIIADTKFEFGTDKSGDLVLIDEVLTPDSSRFWATEHYVEGQNPPSFDKQFVRDYLETLDWNKTAPGPEIPNEVVDKTVALYNEAKTRLAIK